MQMGGWRGGRFQGGGREEVQVARRQRDAGAREPERQRAPVWSERLAGAGWLAVGLLVADHVLLYIKAARWRNLTRKMNNFFGTA